MEELLSSPIKPICFFYTPKTSESPKDAALMHRLRETKTHEYLLTEEVMDFVSDMESPAGLIVLAECPEWKLEPLLNQKNPLIVVLDGLQLPSNAGAVMRVAEAAGAHGIISTIGTCDLYGPKALRASAGSAFRLPAIQSLIPKEILAACREAGLSVVAADAGADKSFTQWDWKKGAAFVLGSEGRGLLDFPASSVTAVRIPMKKPVESLNVSVAAGIILFEACRQREGGQSS